MLNVIPIPALKDNYIWLLVNPNNRHCAIVDPGDATPVLAYLAKEQLTPTAILITHHHHDHTGGIAELATAYALTVYGPANDSVNGLNQKLHGGDVVNLPDLDLQLEVIAIPGHTLGHIAYYGQGMLFCGDTLFAAGCGRVFEGTPLQMYQSLMKLKNLPEATLVYCAHEYTAANLVFAQKVEPQNSEIKERICKVKSLRDSYTPTLPSTLASEKLTNPFLRCEVKSVVDSAQQHFDRQIDDPVSVFQAIRAWKDNF